MLICILTKNVITSCSVTMMLFLHLEVKPLMTLTTVLYLSCALISGHLRSEERFSRNAETDLVCRLLLEKKTTNGQAGLRFDTLTFVVGPNADLSSASIVIDTVATPPRTDA